MGFGLEAEESIYTRLPGKQQYLHRIYVEQVSRADGEGSFPRFFDNLRELTNS
jgi:hypothetical protein